MRGKHGPAEEPRGGEEGALRVEVNMVGGGGGGGGGGDQPEGGQLEGGQPNRGESKGQLRRGGGGGGGGGRQRRAMEEGQVRGKHGPAEGAQTH